MAHGRSLPQSLVALAQQINLLLLRHRGLVIALSAQALAALFHLTLELRAGLLGCASGDGCLAAQARCALLCQLELCLQHLILLAQVQDDLRCFTATAAACTDNSGAERRSSN